MSYYTEILARDISNFINYLCTLNVSKDRLEIIYLDSSTRYYEEGDIVKFEFEQMAITNLHGSEKAWNGSMIIYIDHDPGPEDLFDLANSDYTQIRDNVFIARTDLKDKEKCNNPEIYNRILYSQEVIRRQMCYFQDELNGKLQIIMSKYMHEPMPTEMSALIHICTPSFRDWIEYIPEDEYHKCGFGYIVIHVEDPYFGPEE